MKTNLLIAFAASGLLLAGASSAQEKKIKRSDLPPAVEKTVAAESTGATIKGFSTEKEKGETESQTSLFGRRDILNYLCRPSRLQSILKSPGRVRVG